MKRFFLLFLFVLINYQLFAQNYAFDFSASNTSNIAIGGSDVAPPWTAEMWVYKKATTSYSSVLKGVSSKLDLETWGGSQKVGITKYGIADWTFPSGYVVPVGVWTHLAWVCNGAKTYLYVNGTVKDSLAQVINMPMKAIGNLADKESPNALLDEIRLWKTAKNGSELLAGMNTNAILTDPNLLAYFYGDDQASPANDISTYKRSCPISNVSYVVNSNGNFIMNLPVQSINSILCDQPIVSIVGPGSTNREILRINIKIDGVSSPKNVNSFVIGTNGTTDLNDIQNIKMFYTGSSSQFNSSVQFGVSQTPKSDLIISGMQKLSPGDNYFWVTYDISNNPQIDDLLDATCTSVNFDGDGNLAALPISPGGNRKISIDVMPLYPIATDDYLQWQKRLIYIFMHFSMPTYLNTEGAAYGTDPNIFQPLNLNTGQWVKTVKEAKLPSGIMFTCSHRNGFLNWQSDKLPSLKNSSWRNGKGDVVRELVDSCDKYEMDLGFYMPHHIDHPLYGSGKPYDDLMVGVADELYTNYKPKRGFFELWFDGYDSGQAYNKYRYDSVAIANCPLLFNTNIRWVGNENGIADTVNWCMVDSNNVNYANGSIDGNKWMPAETDVSIRPGWFYHPQEDASVRSVQNLLNLFYGSVGNNSNLNLNIPIMPNGLINKIDSANLVKMCRILSATFEVDFAKGKSVTASNVRSNSTRFAASNLTDGNHDTYWATDDNVLNANAVIDFGSEQNFDKIWLEEYTKLGQRVKSFKLEAWNGTNWYKIGSGATIGYRRIVSVNNITTSKIRLTILDAKACPVLSYIGVFKTPELLNDPVITRDLNGTVSLTCASAPSAKIYYTLDGSVPSNTSTLYTGSFKLLNGGTVKATAYLGTLQSSVVGKLYGLYKKNWKILSYDSQQDASNAATNAIDENPATIWHTAWSPTAKPYPHRLAIDLGASYPISGFGYTPRNDGGTNGIVSDFSIYMPTSASSWGTPVMTSQFGNIKYNPIQQVINLTSTQTSQNFGFEALTEINAKAFASAAEFDIFVSVNNVPTISDQTYLISNPKTILNDASVGTITINGTATNQTLIYSLISSSAVGSVKINALTGEIAVADTSVFRNANFPITARVRLSDSSNPKTGNEATITINKTSTGIKRVQSEKSHLFPNPSSDKITVITSSKISSIKLFNSVNQLQNINLTSLENNQAIVSVLDLANGMYFFQIKHENNTVETLQFLKK